MVIARLIDNVWATRKAEGLNGLKLMRAEVICGKRKGEQIVAVDIISSGIGDRVLISSGSSARKMLNDNSVPVDAIIIGIIDEECVIEEV